MASRARTALGGPRTTALRDNRDPRYFDLGLCGPIRTDLAAQPNTCGMFRTPSLRNVALTAPYMHNGSLATLRDVVRVSDGV